MKVLILPKGFLQNVFTTVHFPKGLRTVKAPIKIPVIDVPESVITEDDLHAFEKETGAKMMSVFAHRFCDASYERIPAEFIQDIIDQGLTHEVIFPIFKGDEQIGRQRAYVSCKESTA